MKDLNKIKELCPSAYDFIVNKAEGAAVGKYDLENGAYVSVQEYTTKARSEAKYEAHKKFIDIQMILSGKELIAVSPIEKMTISDEYNEEKDFMLFHHSWFLSSESGFFFHLITIPGACTEQIPGIARFLQLRRTFSSL